MKSVYKEKKCINTKTIAINTFKDKLRKINKAFYWSGSKYILEKKIILNLLKKANKIIQLFLVKCKILKRMFGISIHEQLEIENRKNKNNSDIKSNEQLDLKIEYDKWKKEHLFHISKLIRRDINK